MSWTSKQQREFGVMLLAMGELFDTPVSPIRAEMFCGAVEDLPFAAVRDAAAAYIRTSTFFPKPADLRRLVEGDVEDEAELAWQYVLREVRRVGYLGAPVWPSEVAQRAAEGLFGSWRALCERLPAEGPELLGFRKQFVALFGATRRRSLAGELGPGRAEATALLEDVTAKARAEVSAERGRQ
jgi:hypothetical protein